MSVAKGEKAGVLVRVKRHFRNMVQEMKKVHWPSKRDIVVYTTVVIIACIFVATLIWIMDLLIGGLMNFLL